MSGPRTCATAPHPQAARALDRALLVGAALVVVIGFARWLVAPPTVSVTALAAGVMVVVALLAAGMRWAKVPLRNELPAVSAAALAVLSLEQAEDSSTLLPVWALGVALVYLVVLRRTASSLPRAAMTIIGGAALMWSAVLIDLPATPWDQLVIGLALFFVVVQLLIRLWDHLHGVRAGQPLTALRTWAVVALGLAYAAGLVVVLEMVTSASRWSDQLAMASVCLLGMLTAWLVLRQQQASRTSRAFVEAARQLPWPAGRSEQILSELVSTHLHLGNVAVEDAAGDPGALSEEIRPGRWLVVRRAPGDVDFTEADRELVSGTAAFARSSYLHEARETQLIQEATTDELTGLYTFAHWRAMLDIKFERREPGERIAVFFIDLDYFKRFNEEFGHFAGDAVLSAMGRRLHGFSRRARWCRFGGDEFVGFVRDVAGETELAELAADVAHALAEPITFEGQQLVATCTVGRSLSVEPTDRAIDYIGAADDDLLRRKHARNASTESTPSDEQVVRALASPGGIDVAYQPIVDLTTETVVGWEALVRGTVGSFGAIAATDLVAAADRMGALDLVSRAVAEPALELVEEAARLFDQPLTLAVNVEPQQLVRGSAFLEWLTRRTAGSPVRVVLELTERGGEPWSPAAADVTAWLARHGITVALDDFGAGVARFSTLVAGRWDSVNLSRAVLAHGDRGHRMLADLVRLLHDLDVEVGIEGIETEHQVEVAKAAGVRYGQGLRLGPPASAAVVRQGWAAGLGVRRSEESGWHTRRSA